MAIHVYAYAPTDSAREQIAQEEQLFCDNLPLLLERAQDILANREYFFCPLPFAWCGLLWIGGGGPFALGHLLLGWRDGIFIEPCPDCGGEVLVTCFSGTVLSGSNSWTGFCRDCRNKKSARDSVHKPFTKRAMFAVSLTRDFPQEISHWEEYDGHAFSWGGDGLNPAKKKRLAVKSVVEPISLTNLIHALSTGRIRQADPPQSTTEESGFQLELRNKNGAVLRFPRA